MSLIRQDPTTKEWVIIATDRAKRPHEFGRSKKERDQPEHDAACPFCPGNEDHTPPAVLQLDARKNDGWAVRVVPNRFAALTGDGEPERREYGPLFREMDGVGYHEVIIETPHHNRFLAEMEDEEVGLILEAYRLRYQTLREKLQVKFVILFKNHGAGAGTSLQHPHSQLVATPIAPVLLRRKYEVATMHYDDTGRCLYCDLVDEERKAGSRMVWETMRFVVFYPFASRVPFETWIAPKEHQPSFAHTTEEDLRELAHVLKTTLGGLSQALGDPDFNYIIHSSPAEDESKAYYLWHIQILPRVTTFAGFELGSGIFINTAVPEESAPFMRQFVANVKKR